MFVFGLFLASSLSLIAEKALTGTAYTNWKEPIPVLSWFSYKYRIIELVFAISLVFATRWYSGTQLAWVILGLSAAWLSVLTDIYDGTIFDLFTLPFVVAFFVISLFAGGFVSSMLGAALGSGISWALSRTKRMGQGDITMMLFYGAWLGLYGLFRALCFGSLVAGIVIVALLIMKKISLQSPLPFAPVMFLGAVLHLWL